MRDIPVFSTDNGVGSLILEEIPYKGCAYIRVHDASSALDFLRECADFCIAVGAQCVFATGVGAEHFPLYNSIVQLYRPMHGLPDTDARLCPVAEDTLELWRSIYNERMLKVSNAATMTVDKAKTAWLEKRAYFVYNRETLLGIGMVSRDTVDAVAAIIPGAGADVLLALIHALQSDEIFVEVSSTNTRALNLYKRLGFVEKERIADWHKII